MSQKKWIKEIFAKNQEKKISSLMESPHWFSNFTRNLGEKDDNFTKNIVTEK